MQRDELTFLVEYLEREIYFIDPLLLELQNTLVEINIDSDPEENDEEFLIECPDGFLLYFIGTNLPVFLCPGSKPIFKTTKSMPQRLWVGSARRGSMLVPGDCFFARSCVCSFACSCARAFVCS